MKNMSNYMSQLILFEAIRNDEIATNIASVAE
jgi:hypothetical protein